MWKLFEPLKMMKIPKLSVSVSVSENQGGIWGSKWEEIQHEFNPCVRRWDGWHQGWVLDTQDLLKYYSKLLKEFFTGTFSRGSRHSDGGGSVCTRPVILGSVLIIWWDDNDHFMSVSRLYDASWWFDVNVSIQNPDVKMHHDDLTLSCREVYKSTTSFSTSKVS